MMAKQTTTMIPRPRSARDAFARLVAGSPVPVVVGPRVNCYVFRDIPPGEPLGRPGDPPAPYITLCDGSLGDGLDRRPYARMASHLLHELGHHACRSSGCGCFSSEGLESGLCEAHAYRFQLRECIRRRLPAAHCETVRLILRGSRCLSPSHRLGTRMVLRSAAWPAHLRLVPALARRTRTPL